MRFGGWHVKAQLAHSAPIKRHRFCKLSRSLATHTLNCWLISGDTGIICRPTTLRMLYSPKSLHATLITRDARLASSHGHRAKIELF